jgi:branched-chain amino acid transport system substrate-binding protein
MLEEMIRQADSLEPAALKQAAIDLSGEITVMTGPYEIEPTGKQVSMELITMQLQPGGLEAVWPEAVRTAEPVYPVPPFDER